MKDFKYCANWQGVCHILVPIKSRRECLVVSLSSQTGDMRECTGLSGPAVTFFTAFL